MSCRGRRRRRTMQRELTYQVAFERLVNLGRLAVRNAYPARWLLWLVIALFVAALAFLYAYGDEIRDVAQDEGIPFAPELAFIVVFLAYIVGLRLLRRYQLRLAKERASS